jgi:tetratricopeptide (TPR) repeat protein
MIRSAGASVLVVLAAGSARAQSGAILGQENVEFARALHVSGYSDLAEGMCSVIENESETGRNDLQVKALRFELRLAAAKDEQDLVKRNTLIQGILKDAGTFIDENTRARAATMVREMLPEAYLQLGETLTGLLDAETNPEKIAQLREEGRSSYTQAENSLKERVEKFSERQASGGLSAYDETQYQQAWYNLGRTYYFHALLHPEGDPEGNKLLELSRDTFLAFGLDYGLMLSNFEGYIYQGLCSERLKQTRDALEAYDLAIGLRDFYDPNAQGVYEVSSQEADVISGATMRKMKLLTQSGKPREAIKAGEEFFKTIPEPLTTSSGPAVLLARSEAEIASGDIVKAAATAQEMMDFDSSGPWGQRARELLGRLPVQGLPPDKILRVAETASARGEFARALDLCRLAREMNAAGANSADLGAEAFFLTGNIYRWQGQLHEATVAFDCAAELYPASKKAADALWRAVNTYLDLHTKEKRGFYSRRVDERMNSLATKYPESPFASNVSIIIGRRLEAQQDYAGAAEAYNKIAPGSTNYEEAVYRAARVQFLLALSEAKEKKPTAKETFRLAEQGFQKAMELLDKARASTLDAEVQQRLASLYFSAYSDLASLHLETGAADKVPPLLDRMEKLGEELGNDPDRLTGLWSLRIRTLQALGRTDEAITLFESLLQKSPNAPGISAIAGNLARALDQAGVDLFAKDSASEQAAEYWRKAAYYYGVSIKRQLDESEPLEADQITEVAQRLYVMGLHFNGVPEGMDTFVDWQGTVKDPTLWEEAVRIYQKLSSLSPYYLREIELARTHALLGRVKEAAAIYAKLFDQNVFFDPADATKEHFNPSVVEKRPELVSAYLEWGVAERMTGIAESDPARLERATSIFEKVQSAKNTDESMRIWWQAKYYLLRVLMDRGKYPEANIGLKSLRRTTSQANLEKFGFKEKLDALEKELKTKVFPQK